MNNESVTEYQDGAVIRLQKLFGENNVLKEWDVGKKSRDSLTRDLYCPRVDIAVGPFNIDRNLEKNNKMINSVYSNFLPLIEIWRENSDIKNIELRPHDNPRCFLVIEIENKSSRKHRIGSILNASAIGKIGIIVAWDDKVMISLSKIRRYLNFLKDVRKLSEDAFQNVMVIERDVFLRTLKQQRHLTEA